tara:strand:- start:937 stop:1374 length:438 start_codon:yes stop_codon:yes gene_type:complete
MREINLAIIHCTATNPSWYSNKSAEDVVNEIRRWHINERKWSDIGYSHIIHRDGVVALGRPIARSGAHTRGYNKHSVGLALVGGRGGCADDKPLDHYTDKQMVSLRNLLDQLHDEHPITKVAGHNDFAKKACPCFNVAEWFDAKK